MPDTNLHAYAVCWQPEVAGDVISGEDVDTFRDFFGARLWFVRVSRKSKSAIYVIRRYDGGFIWTGFWRVKEHNV